MVSVTGIKIYHQHYVCKKKLKVLRICQECECLTSLGSRLYLNKKAVNEYRLISDSPLRLTLMRTLILLLKWCLNLQSWYSHAIYLSTIACDSKVLHAEKRFMGIYTKVLLIQTEKSFEKEKISLKSC